jgi:geranylgeranyl reductase family protein
VLAYDALIVGGGPAGSTCARSLTRAGWRVAVIDAARFPRDKVCAGWLTPEVFPLLDLEPAEYRGANLTLQEITGFRTGVIRARSIETRYREVVSYAIRRCEFDDFLLRRSGAFIHEATPTTSLARTRGRWVVNGTFAAPVLVGAGGHFCPVARHLSGPATPADPVIAQETEYAVENASASVDGTTPELFFCRDLDGYAWCVRKGRYVNAGIGRRRAAGFGTHRDEFIAFLEGTGRAPGVSRTRWRGHAYLASGAGPRPLVDEGLLLVGDAAGLAFPESGEGIRPAIESGAAAARTLLAAGGRFSCDRLEPYALEMRRLHPPALTPRPPGTVYAALGRALLQVRPFARHVVLDRWFLRRF